MATVGPTLEKPDDLRRAIQVGARWFRLPCGYRQRPHLDNARAVREAAAQEGIPVQLLVDLPSSRPRTGLMQELHLAIGDHVEFWDPKVLPDAPTKSRRPPAPLPGSADTVMMLNPKVSKNGTLPVPLPGLAELLGRLLPQERMWFCDGRLSFVVDELREGSVLTHLAQGDMPLKSSNALFLPDSPSPFAVVTPQDLDLLNSLAAHRLLPDWVALSLIGSPQDVRDARKETLAHLGREVRLMAKFETIDAVECAEDIISEADGIMVARGDLGLALGYIRLPEAQERLVEAARRAGKVAVVATQILEGFAETGLPQRAELSDLSLIARQRADAVMLGKETVYSPRPIECIRLASEVLAHETRRFEASGRRTNRRVPQAQECRP